jgi:hypothetical protein
MGIEFLKGEITDEQVVIPRTMRVPELALLQDGDCTYIAETGLWMDRNGSLWVDILTPSLKDLIPRAESDFVRVMKLPKGFVVDISQVTANFVDDETGEFVFMAQDAPETIGDGLAFERAPVIGFLVSDGEVAEFRDLVKKTYNYVYPESAPATDT